jgi:hypothetical protein
MSILAGFFLLLAAKMVTGTQIVQGRVLSRDGTPIPGLVVSIVTPSFRNPPAVTRRDGSYQLTIKSTGDETPYIEVYWGNAIMYRGYFPKSQDSVINYPDIYLRSAQASQSSTNKNNSIQVWNTLGDSEVQLHFMDTTGNSLGQIAVPQGQNDFVNVPNGTATLTFSKPNSSYKQYPFRGDTNIYVYLITAQAAGPGINVSVDTLSDATKDQTGWLNIGTDLNASWQSDFVDFSAGRPPQSGDVLHIIRMIDLRSDRASGRNWIAILRPGRTIQVMEAQPRWLNVRVVD